MCKSKLIYASCGATCQQHFQLGNKKRFPEIIAYIHYHLNLFNFSKRVVLPHKYAKQLKQNGNTIKKMLSSLFYAHLNKH